VEESLEGWTSIFLDFFFLEINARKKGLLSLKNSSLVAKFLKIHNHAKIFFRE
jgi:hypothetical protein